MKINWKPTERQTRALLSEATETLYGGARGGGKTDAGMVWMVNPDYISNPLYRGLVIRRNADDLRDWQDRARMMYRGLRPTFVGQPAEITFPSGAIIRLGHLKDENAYTKYQGHEYQKILFEELTKIARESDYEKLLGSCRSTIPGLRAQIFATTNPDGDGYEWVKERFDCLNPDEQVRIISGEGTKYERSRLFIPAKVDDNPHLMDNDPGYVAYLESISDETLRKQWRDGSWEEPKIEGAYYAKQIEQARLEGRICKVPYEENLLVDTWWDLGMNDSTSIWFTQTHGAQIRVIDYLSAEGEGLKYYKKELEKKGYLYDTHYMPHDIEVREMGTGVSRKETALSIGLKPLEVVEKLDISDGIEAVRNIFSRCWFDEKKCREGLRSLKNYKKEYDEKRAVYKNRPLHDWASHGADGFRYLAVGHGQYKDKIKKGTRQFIPRLREFMR